MNLKSKRIKETIALADAVLKKVERNETENADFEKLSNEFKANSWQPSTMIRVILHLLNRMRRLEKRVRELEGD